MKKPVNLFLLFLLVWLTAAESSAQQPLLVASSTRSEKSKDSHSTTETFSISGTLFRYSIKYKGRRTANQKDSSRECVLSATDIESVQSGLRAQQLDVMDSLNLPGTDHSGMQRSVSISIQYSVPRKPGRVKITGDPSLFENRPLYKSALLFMEQLRALRKKCS